LHSRSSWKCLQTLGLTGKLQIEAGDVFYAYNEVTNIIDNLKG
jgi:hypothetical protein